MQVYATYIDKLNKYTRYVLLVKNLEPTSDKQKVALWKVKMNCNSFQDT